MPAEQYAAPMPAPTPAHGDPASRTDLASQLAGRLCHDLIGPVSGLISALDLLKDPSAQEVREQTLALIDQSGRRLGDLLTFARTAYGASADASDPGVLETLARALYAPARAELDWAVGPGPWPRGAARVLLNLAQLGLPILPMGGTARLTVDASGGRTVVQLHASSPRARLRPEIAAGLAGQPKPDTMPGHWVPAFYLHQLVCDLGGRIEAETPAEAVTVRVVLPG